MSVQIVKDVSFAVAHERLDLKLSHIQSVKNVYGESVGGIPAQVVINVEIVKDVSLALAHERLDLKKRAQHRHAAQLEYDSHVLRVCV